MKQHEREESLDQKILWDYQDLQRFGGVSRTTAYALLNRADLPVVRIGGRRFMNARKFAEWVDGQTQGAKTEF